MSIQLRVRAPRVLLGGVLLATGLVASSCIAAEESAPVAESQIEATLEALANPRPITAAEIAELTAHPSYQSTVEILGEGGSSIQLSSGVVYTYDRNPSESEILFHPKDAAGNPDRQFAEVVYQRVRDIQEPFYFTPHGAAGAPASKAQGVGQGAEQSADCGSSGELADVLSGSSQDEEGDIDAAACGPWSPWTISYTRCEARFWCFGKGQVGLFAYKHRQRVCSWGTQLGQRRDFIRCGC